jgi:WD40 repeat protein
MAATVACSFMFASLMNALTAAMTAEAPSTKRQRHDDGVERSTAVALYNPTADADVHSNIRTSSLASSTVKLSGHKRSVYCLAYDPAGEVLCSGSFDSTCLLWNGELLLALMCMWFVNLLTWIFFFMPNNTLKLEAAAKTSMYYLDTRTHFLMSYLPMNPRRSSRLVQIIIWVLMIP